MRSLATLVMMTSACSFSAHVDGGPTGDDMTGDDAPLPDGSTSNVVPCKTPDPTGLVVCLEFEDGVADGELDDSSPARRNASTSGMEAVQRPDASGGLAVDVGPMAATYVAQAGALDLGAGYTLSAWVKPDTLPAASSARGVLDHEGQYAMIVSANAAGSINNRCQHTGVAKYEYTDRLPVGQWSFMACTWDGTHLCAWRWASPTDHEHFCHTPMYPPAATGARGLAVGHLSSGGAPHSRFDGALDSVQVYDRGLTEAQLCALIGQPASCMPCDSCT